MSALVDDLLDETVAAPVDAPAPGAPEDWKPGKAGGEYIGRNDGRPGSIKRQGDETVEQARARDSSEERRPRRKPKAAKLPPKPPAPKKIDLKQLENALAEGLKAPGIVCAGFGEEYLATHFFNAGPYLARNLVVASEQNPWLRQKLEEAASGEQAMMKVIGIMGIGGAVFAYAAPPVIYLLNLPVPPKAREMLGVPERRGADPGPPNMNGQTDAGIPQDQASPADFTAAAGA